MSSTSPVTSKLEPAIEIIYAGGTSAISASPEGCIASGRAFNLIGLLEERFPDFKPDFQFSRKQVAYTLLSENITPVCWDTLDEKIENALANNPRGILITHGIDSLEQTVKHLNTKFLKRLQASGQKIVLTGANQDIEDPQTDAWDNLMFAMECAGGDEPAGLYVAFHERLIPAMKAVKLPYVKGQDQTTFVSRLDTLYQQTVTAQDKQAAAQSSELIELYGRQPDDQAAINYAVNIIRPNHQHLLDTLTINTSVKSILLTLYNFGTANTEKAGQSVAELVTYLRVQKGITCFAVTETGKPVNLHAYETSVKLRKAGVVPLYDMLPTVALTKLQLLAADLPAIDLIDEMLATKVGELDESHIIRDDIVELKKLYK